MNNLLKRLINKVDMVICVGFTPVDESKTTKKINPFTGQNSYFFNDRIKTFNDVFYQTAGGAGSTVTFLDLFNAASELGWVDSCLSPDGLHPNDKGHRWICNQVLPLL